MSGSFPTSPVFNSLNVSSVQPTLISRTISGRRQARQIAGQYWKMTATFPPMTRTQFAPIFAFVMAQRGGFETFTVVPPVLKDGLGSAGGTPLIKGASQTGRSILTDGWTNSTTVFKAGDYVKFTGHDKVYMLTANAISDGSGNATLAIEPALVATPANDSAIIFENISFTVALNGSVQEFRTGASGFFSYEIDFAEVL